MDVMLDLQVPAGGLLAVPMSRAEFDRLDVADELPRRSEWYDGLCVVSPAARPHSAVSARIAALLLPFVAADHELLVEAGWRTPSGTFIPDFAVCSVDDPGDPYLEGPPLLVIEVLSPSTRRVDLGRKRELYALGGASWYWVVDPTVPAAIVFERHDDDFVEVQRIGPGETAATVGPYRVPTSPDALVRRGGS